MHIRQRLDFHDRDIIDAAREGLFQFLVQLVLDVRIACQLPKNVDRRDCGRVAASNPTERMSLHLVLRGRGLHVHDFLDFGNDLLVGQCLFRVLLAVQDDLI